MIGLRPGNRQIANAAPRGSPISVAKAVADRLTETDSAMICHSSRLAKAFVRVAKSLTGTVRLNYYYG